MKVLKFNIYCNTAKEAIAEINALMSEYKGMLIEFNVNIMLDEQKEPIDLTIDSKGINSTEVFYLVTNSIKSPSENDKRWSTNIPSLGNGDFLWEKIVNTYADEKSVELILAAKMWFHFRKR